MRIAIHQPNFFPWMPFFQKMAAVDMFVLLCHCQFEKGKYQNRFRLNGEWFTMAVNHGLDPIVDKQYVSHAEDWAAIKRRLPQYAKLLARFDKHIGAGLSWTNCAIIGLLADMLSINTMMVTDEVCGLTATDRLVSICLRHKATTYLAGKSGANYLEPEKFKQAGIKLEYQDLEKADARHTLEVLSERLS